MSYENRIESCCFYIIVLCYRYRVLSDILYKILLKILQCFINYIFRLNIFTTDHISSTARFALAECSSNIRFALEFFPIPNLGNPLFNPSNSTQALQIGCDDTN